MADVLALTEVNYNACDYVSGLPVTLKFADRAGEILTALPRGRSGCPRAESRRDYQKASGEFTIIHGWDLPLRVIVARLVEALRLPNDVPNFVVCPQVPGGIATGRRSTLYRGRRGMTGKGNSSCIFTTAR